MFILIKLKTHFLDVQSNCKESSPTQTSTQSNNFVNQENCTNGIVQNNSAASSQKQNNNNKGENGVSSRRGKSNSESKAQAARNKHKNSQNKEKHSNPSTRATSRSESNSNLTANGSSQPQVNGQKEIVNLSGELSTSTTTTPTSAITTTTTSGETGVQKSNVVKLKTDQSAQQQTNKVSKLTQQVRDLTINGIVVNGELTHAENEVDLQREGSTPASTVSSSEDSSILNHQGERLADSNEEAGILGSSPASSNSSQGLGQQPPPGLHSNTSQTQSQSINHRSIFQSDNNSFFSSNTFQKIPTTIGSSASTATTQTTNTSVDWTNPGIAPIPDSLPTVYSSEDWQAAFGFQTAVGSSLTVLASPKSSPSPSPRISFSNEDFIDSEDQIYASSHFENNSHQNNIASSILANTSASKFTIPDLQQNSLQQRLAMQVLHLDIYFIYYIDFFEILNILFNN